MTKGTPISARVSHLVGQCHSDQHQRFAIQHSGEPRAWSCAVAGSPLDDGHVTDDEQTADVPLAHF
jgi:hypothetical protein